MVVKPLRVKIISIGNAEVGKSCVIKRYCEKRFVSKYLPTIGIDFGVTKVTSSGKILKVNIFDMSGLPIFYDVRSEFYKDSQGVILLFDVTKRESFENLTKWHEELCTEIESGGLDRMVVFVCGNKIDGNRVVTFNEARQWALHRRYQYCETSAMTGEGINELFENLFKGMICVQEGKPLETQQYSQEEVEVIARILETQNPSEQLKVRAGADKDEINKAYRKIASLIHPDKCSCPGAEEAFKTIVKARTSLLPRS